MENRVKVLSVCYAVIIFIVGLLIGILGAVTLRHEIWPIADKVGILIFYGIVASVLFTILFIWYLRIIQTAKKQILEPWFSSIIKFFNFLIVFIFLIIIIGGGLVFIAVT
jgi:hypothetical protein